MLRILAFFLVVLALSLGFGWLADNPGSVTFDWQGQTVQTSMMIFLIALGALIGWDVWEQRPDEPEEAPFKAKADWMFDDLEGTPESPS